MRLGARVPALFQQLRSYTFKDFTGDVGAGLVVGAVAIPLAIAFAIASQVGANAPQVGLVTVVVAGTVAALLGGSRFLVTGPTGAFIVVLAGVVQRHGLDGLLLATFLAGGLLVLAGVLRLGAIIKFIPYPVTTGFTAGIAVVIFIGQLPDVFGITLVDAPVEALPKLAAVVQGIIDQGIAWGSFALVLATIGIIMGFKRFLPRVPGPIVALIVLTVVIQAPVWFTGSEARLLDVSVIGDKFTIPRGLPAPGFPDVSYAKIVAIFPDAVTIALLGAIESLLAAVVADGMMRTRHDSNQELVAQGVANMASPLFGGIAATGAIARTATSIQNGARSPIASLVHVGVVLLVLFFLAPLASLIPIPVLAGILVVVAWNMSERHHFRHLLRMHRTDAGVMLITFALTIAVDLTTAVMVGLVLAVAVFMHRMSEATQTRIIGVEDEELRLGNYQEEDIPEGVVVYSIDGPFFFGAADAFQSVFARVAAPPRAVVFRLRNVPFMDATGAKALIEAVEGFQRMGSDVHLSAVNSQPMDALMRYHITKRIGDDHVHRTTLDALRRLQQDPSQAG